MKKEISQKEKLVFRGINFLSWASPLSMIGFGIFFPLGVIFLFPKEDRVRRPAFHSILLQVILGTFLFSLEFLFLFFPSLEDFFSRFILVDPSEKSMFGLLVLGLMFFTGLAIFFLQAKFVRKRLKPSEPQPLILNPVLVFLIVLCIVVFTNYLTYSDDFSAKLSTFSTFSESIWIFFVTTIGLVEFFSGKKPFFLFRKPWAWFIKQSKDSFALENENTKAAERKRRNAKIRDIILPGWGHIYTKHVWKGFPILFVYLLGLLLFASFFFSWIEPAMGIRFLASLGLKPGISDKKFFDVASSIWIWITIFGILSLVNLFSGWLLRRSFYNKTPLFGLIPGFENNVALSVLAHLVIIALVLFMPTTIIFQKSENKSRPTEHFQPENHAEFYFIDPNLPDEVKGLNGGVITGTDTPNSNEGEKVPDEKPADEGRVKGEVKRIKGKKLPATYSNYISAKMRTYESFMDYWRSAPQNYSCVVAYTITPDGEVVDVELVEGSSYPEQDRRTLELIENLTPLMPPPGTKGYIRVTELFWNGPLDAKAMPTTMQQELVNMFDGRYMEEL
ncbi:energy transducer TonB [Leptospira sarikeiensis]|uniref:Energy transducer TonB n=1 Tax=Leptospira sarikeiensis TaxID=2484943 RepID=A0A4R9KBL3_9LEPT|nr:TonB C-terminal domain-containing protein [Leptospira sarikeiensis]TGL64124.1 energy transducer TonB [Leptospira sarikeiensis]